MSRVYIFLTRDSLLQMFVCKRRLSLRAKKFSNWFLKLLPETLQISHIMLKMNNWSFNILVAIKMSEEIGKAKSRFKELLDKLYPNDIKPRFEICNSSGTCTASILVKGILYSGSGSNRRLAEYDAIMKYNNANGIATTPTPIEIEDHSIVYSFLNTEVQKGRILITQYNVDNKYVCKIELAGTSKIFEETASSAKLAKLLCGKRVFENVNPKRVARTFTSQLVQHCRDNNCTSPQLKMCSDRYYLDLYKVIDERSSPIPFVVQSPSSGISREDALEVLSERLLNLLLSSGGAARLAAPSPAGTSHGVPSGGAARRETPPREASSNGIPSHDVARNGVPSPVAPNFAFPPVAANSKERPVFVNEMKLSSVPD